MVPVTDIIAAVTIVNTNGLPMQCGDKLNYNLNKRYVSRFTTWYACSGPDYDKGDERQAIERVTISTRGRIIGHTDLKIKLCTDAEIFYPAM